MYYQDPQGGGEEWNQDGGWGQQWGQDPNQQVNNWDTELSTSNRSFIKPIFGRFKMLDKLDLNMHASTITLLN